MNDNKFEYVYLANQQDEIKKIREKYISKEEDKLIYLKKLDESVVFSSSMESISVGVIGALIFGTGMSFCMVWTDSLLIPGVFIGIFGMILMVLAYPVFMYSLKKKREKIAPEIIKLTDELLK